MAVGQSTEKEKKTINTYESKRNNKRAAELFIKKRKSLDLFRSTTNIPKDALLFCLQVNER